MQIECLTRFLNSHTPLQAFIEDEDNPPDIWAHDGILGEFTRVFSTVNGATYKRSMRQFGVHLPGQINAGIGLKLKYGTDKATLGVVYPTHFVHEQKTDLILAGKLFIRLNFRIQN